MGIFDEIKSAVGMGAAAQPAQNPGAMAAVLDYINSPQVGGLSGLQQMFQQKGLGGVMASWIGTGQNSPISSEQLQNVLHSDALQAAAQRAGVDPSQLTSVMSQLLPHVVDHLTPNGQIPDASSVTDMMKKLTGGSSASS